MGKLEMDHQETGSKYVDWINLAHKNDQYGALAKTVINLRFHKERRISWPCERLLDSQKRCYMDFIIINFIY
jgi:hypothetical protein